tara:strand:+ start:11476 stop:11895 length:420 start_codon:yes stop_codon:yes gene_type:complete
MNNQEKLFVTKQANIFRRYISLLGGSKGQLKNMSDKLMQNNASLNELVAINKSIADAGNQFSGGFYKQTINRPGSRWHGMDIDHPRMAEFEEMLSQGIQKGWRQESNLKNMMQKEKLKVLLARLGTGGVGAYGAYDTFS